MHMCLAQPLGCASSTFSVFIPSLDKLGIMMAEMAKRGGTCVRLHMMWMQMKTHLHQEFTGIAIRSQTSAVL